jgi:hypothetical protein
MSKYKINEEVEVIYNAMPLYPISIKKGKIIKITPSGLLRIKTDLHNELFDPDTGKARGWDTLAFNAIICRSKK